MILNYTNTGLSLAVQKADATKRRRREFARQEAYNIEHTVTCLSTDPLTDPPINRFVQRRCGSYQPTLGQSWASEAAGDGAAFTAFTALAYFCPQTMRAYRDGMGMLADPFYRAVGKSATAHWAAEHGVDEDSDAARHHFREWKRLQEDTFANAAFLSTASTACNVLFQKMIQRNSNPWHVVLLAKALGAGSTALIMTGTRLAFPHAARHLDKALDTYCISPLVRASDACLGVDDSARAAPAPSYRDRVSQSRSGSALCLN
jgi:hypothetical protein